MNGRRAAALARYREERAARNRAANVVRGLRAIYYPEQRAFATSRAPRIATRKTRRAGATSATCRELIARCLESRQRWTYCNTTKDEIRRLAWENDTQSGFLDIIRQYGTPIERPRSSGTSWFEVGGVIVEVRQGEMALNFGNGSRIDTFGADDSAALDKLRGVAKHGIVVDEAQKFPHLKKFVRGVATPALRDFNGQLVLEGTPAEDCAGLFFEITDDESPPMPGWEVHVLNVTMNPFWGDTPAARFERACGQDIREQGLSIDDPDVQREWFGRWVRVDARYVYAAHQVPRHLLCFAPARIDADGFPDIPRALLDLPGYADGREYFLALGADLGTRDPFAFVLWAWSLEDPVLYEVCSWKKKGLGYDAMAEYLRQVRDVATVGLITADAGGGGKGAVTDWSQEWSARYGLSIIAAGKTDKHIGIKEMNTDTKRGWIRLREGGVLLAEWLTHRWAPLRSARGYPVEDSTDNHASDAGLYGYRESYHHRFREPEVRPDPGSPAWALQEEAELEQDLLGP